MYMVLVVLNDPERIDDLLKAWVENGITGATIVESEGLYSRRQKRIPARYLFPNLDAGSKDNFTLFALVTEQASVDKCLEISERILGDFEEPDTGVFAAWPVTTIKGVRKQHEGSE